MLDNISLTVIHPVLRINALKLNVAVAVATAASGGDGNLISLHQVHPIQSVIVARRGPSQ